MAILKRPMFRKGGSANSGIMDGLDRGHYANGGTIGGGMITGNPMGYRTGFKDPISLEQIISGKKAQRGTQYTEDYIKSMYDQYVQNLEGDIPQTDLAYGMQMTAPKTIKEQSILELIQTQPDKAYEMFKTGELGGVDYATEQEEQTEALTEAGVKFDKEIFGYTPNKKEIIPPGEVDGPGYVPPEIPSEIKKTTGDLDDISVSDVNKERMKLFAPHMQKRMMNDALAAASGAFGESTGDTKQDIANAISAAAAATGGTKDIADKVSLLTLQGEIQKDIARETYKPNATQSMIDFYRHSAKMSDKEIVEELSKDKLDITDFMRTATTTKGAYKSFAQHEHGDNPKWGGSLPEDKKGAVDGEKAKEIMEVGKFYFDQDKLIYVQVVLEDGEKKIKKVVPK